MSRIYWDTILLVYWLEEHPRYGARVQEIFATMQDRGDTLCTSTFTSGELLTGPVKRGAADVANQIKPFLRSPAVELLPSTMKARSDTPASELCIVYLRPTPFTLLPLRKRVSTRSSQTTSAFEG